MKSENRFVEFLKGKKGMGKLLILLLVGVVLLSLGGLSGAEKDEPVGELDTYGAVLEDRIAELCSSLDGVGRARAMVTFSSGEVTLYEGSRAVGKKPPEVMAVTVLCEGAERGDVAARLTDMLASLFGIGTNRVKIMKLSS